MIVASLSAEGGASSGDFVNVDRHAHSDPNIRRGIVLRSGVMKDLAGYCNRIVTRALAKLDSSIFNENVHGR